jgi:hypothetical protein
MQPQFAQIIDTHHNTHTLGVGECGLSLALAAPVLLSLLVSRALHLVLSHTHSGCGLSLALAAPIPLLLLVSHALHSRCLVLLVVLDCAVEGRGKRWAREDFISILYM